MAGRSFQILFLRYYQSLKIGDCCVKSEKKPSKFELVYFFRAPTFTADAKLAGHVLPTSGVNGFLTI